MRAARKLIARAGGRVMAAIHGAQPDRFVTTGYGVLMRANWRDRTFQYAWAASYGRALADLLERRERPFVFLDIGANQGLYSLIAARNAACALVVAVEPVAATFALLEGNIAANSARARVRPIHAALSNSTGESAIRTCPHHSGAATLRIDHRFGDQTEMVALIRPDALLPCLPDAIPIIVKVDVEGHEETVIDALLACAFAGRIDTIVYEMDERWTDPAQLRRTLSRAGLIAFRKLGLGRHYDMLASRADLE
jgi:FkbM family methyltransferase